MKEAFLAFLEKPSRESFLEVRRLIVESPHYDPYSRELDEVAALAEEGKHEEALATIQGAMPNLLLSPQAHIYAAFLARSLGRADEARFEGFLAHLCSRAIVETGAGTEEEPYLVMRVSDEHDVLRLLEKNFVKQALVKKGDRRLDCLTVESGETLWFDVSDAHEQMRNALFSPPLDGTLN